MAANQSSVWYCPHCGHQYPNPEIDARILASREMLEKLAEHEVQCRACGKGVNFVLIVTGQFSRRPIRVEVPDSGVQCLVLTAHAGAVNGLHFHGDSKTLLTGDSKGQLCVWNLAAGGKTPSRTFSTGEDGVGCLVTVGDARMVVGHAIGSVSLWDLKTEKRIGRPNQQDLSGISAIAYSEARDFVLTGGEDGSVRMWGPIKSSDRLNHIRKIGGMFSKYSHRIRALAISPDGRRALISSDSYTQAALWDLESGKVIAKADTKNFVSVVGFADAKRVFYADNDGKLHTADASNLAKVSEVELAGEYGAERISQMAITPDGRYICAQVYVRHKLAFMIFDTQQRKAAPLGAWDFDSGAARPIAIARDGRRVAAVPYASPSTVVVFGG